MMTYAVVTQDANVKYMSADDYKLFKDSFNMTTNKDAVLGVICPFEFDTICNDKMLKTNKYPLEYLLLKPNVGIVFAATHGLMSLFNVTIHKFKLKYERFSATYKNTAMKAFSAAVIGGHIDIVRVCRSNLYDVDLSDLALLHKKLDILQDFASCCSFQRYSKYKIFTELCKVSKLFGDIESFKSILNAYKDRQDATTFKDMINKILIHAVQKSKFIEIVEILISYGADDYEKPVSEAASNGCFDVVQLLLDNVNDVQTVDMLKQYAVLGAASVDNFDMFKKYFTETSDLHQAILNTKNVDILDFCIRKGAVVTTDVIMHAVDVYDDNNMIKYLIENRLATNFKKMLLRAIKKSNQDKIGYLLKQVEKQQQDDNVQHLHAPDYEDLILCAMDIRDHELNDSCYHYHTSDDDEKIPCI